MYITHYYAQLKTTNLGQCCFRESKPKPKRVITFEGHPEKPNVPFAEWTRQPDLKAPEMKHVMKCEVKRTTHKSI